MRADVEVVDVVVSLFLNLHLVMNLTRLSRKMYCHQSLNSLHPQEQVCYHSYILIPIKGHK